MYFPYLRARQFELISLRELATSGIVNNKVMPVLEPVKSSFSGLNLACNIFQEKNFKAFLIVNPCCGEIAGDRYDVLNYLKELNGETYLPAFIYTDNSNYILSCIDKYNLENCLIVCLDKFSDEEQLKELSTRDEISHLMLLDPNKYRGLDKYMKLLDINYIRLDDLFEKQQRNSDFLDIAAHKFTEEHLYYKEDGYQGFSDYTILPSDFVDGGSTPRAVVIHLTYPKSEVTNEVWISHFTSESNDSIENVQGKFAEATKKAITFCDSLPLDNIAIDELRKYFTDKKYPGLGTVKKISIKNHVLVINELI
ncbi:MULTISPECIES: sce7725 family protein [Providencia]|uniref:Sce7725 family protein n=12 Tax=Providencia TaxID=586 RepID=A0A264VTG9_PRORE|nr:MULTISPECIES: sce7725 family protein [Providencia]MBJ9970166.1 sce7725 family protein [Providencia rettgeri]MBN7842672.1 sce7725 family protein [Providencia rettgeri]MBN7854968.1 sce7725 family protein [Providencia rettgeri]MBN7861518.1 sce7725 family protein [Providencia rettgeri]MBN7897187.1 sce7725 family protein [Providencia rettgeri]